MTRAFYSFLFILSSLFIFQSCDERMEMTPSAYGDVDNIMVVADGDIWDGATSDTFKHYFASLFPVTPQPEPIFDIRHVESKEFNKVLKTHRAIVLLADLSDDDDDTAALVRRTLGEEKLAKAMKDTSYCIAIHNDRWADGQTVIYLFAPDVHQLIRNIDRTHQVIIQKFNEADSKKLSAQLYYRGENKFIHDKLAKDLGLSLRIPNDYQEARSDSILTWLRKETPELSSNIFISVLDGNTEISPENLHKTRNQLTVDFSTRIENSYMHIDDRYLPVYYTPNMKINGYPCLEARGLWGMVNDFMGGAFLSYMIKDEKNNRVIFIDGFVHHPGKPKRPEMRKLEAIFSTIDLNPTIVAETSSD